MTLDRLLAWAEEAGLHAQRWRRRAAPLERLLGGEMERLRAAPLARGTVWVALFCGLAMAVIDRPLALFLKAHVGGDVEGFFRIVTNLGLAQLYLVPAGLAWLGCVLMMRRARRPEERGRWRRLAWKPAFVVLAMAASGLVESLLKFGIGRLRPRLLFDVGVYGFEPFNHHWAMNSFPSGHSQAAWAAMTALMVLVPRHALLCLVVAVLVAASRVFLTVHYLSDAVAGSWLGFAAAMLVARQLRRRGVDLS